MCFPNIPYFCGQCDCSTIPLVSHLVNHCRLYAKLFGSWNRLWHHLQGMLCNAMSSGVSTGVPGELGTSEYRLWDSVDIYKLTSIIMSNESHASRTETDEQVNQLVTAFDVASLRPRALDSPLRAIERSSWYRYWYGTVSHIVNISRQRMVLVYKAFTEVTHACPSAKTIYMY